MCQMVTTSTQKYKVKMGVAGKYLVILENCVDEISQRQLDKESIEVPLYQIGTWASNIDKG